MLIKKNNNKGESNMDKLISTYKDFYIYKLGKDRGGKFIIAHTKGAGYVWYENNRPLVFKNKNEAVNKINKIDSEYNLITQGRA
jgi:predicted glutamine amidotransferase